MLQRPGSSWGFGALLKDTSVVVLKEVLKVIHSPTNNPCRTWDSNPQPLDYKSDALTIRPRLPLKLLERNKDLTFIVIFIDIDWYEKNYRDNFFGHIAQPYVKVFVFYITVNVCIVIYLLKFLPKYVWYNYEVVPIFKKKKKFIKIIFIWNSHQKFRIINC